MVLQLYHIQRVTDILDTNTGVIEVFLPTSLSRGDTIILIDYGTFGTNQVIVNTGTQNLDSTTTRQYKLTTNDTIGEFCFMLILVKVG